MAVLSRPNIVAATREYGGFPLRRNLISFLNPRIGRSLWVGFEPKRWQLLGWRFWRWPASWFCPTATFTSARLVSEFSSIEFECRFRHAPVFAADVAQSSADRSEPPQNSPDRFAGFLCEFVPASALPARSSCRMLPSLRCQLRPLMHCHGRWRPLAPSVDHLFFNARGPPDSLNIGLSRFAPARSVAARLRAQSRCATVSRLSATSIVRIIPSIRVYVRLWGSTCLHRFETSCRSAVQHW